MKTCRNEQLGFEIDVPEDWSLPTGGALDDIICHPDEAIDFEIGPQLPELVPDYIERDITRYAQGMGYTNLEFGRISVGGKEHVWARYHRGCGQWTKKYILAFGGIQYVITTTGTNSSRSYPINQRCAKFKLTVSINSRSDLIPSKNAMSCSLKKTIGSIEGRPKSAYR